MPWPIMFRADRPLTVPALPAQGRVAHLLSDEAAAVWTEAEAVIARLTAARQRGADLVEHQLPDAVAADRKAAEDAVRAGKPGPGPARERKVRAAMDDARHDAEAAGRVLSQALARLEAALVADQARMGTVAAERLREVIANDDAAWRDVVEAATVLMWTHDVDDRPSLPALPEADQLAAAERTLADLPAALAARVLALSEWLWNPDYEPDGAVVPATVVGATPVRQP